MWQNLGESGRVWEHRGEPENLGESGRDWENLGESGRVCESVLTTRATRAQQRGQELGKSWERAGGELGRSWARAWDQFGTSLESKSEHFSRGVHQKRKIRQVLSARSWFKENCLPTPLPQTPSPQKSLRPPPCNVQRWGALPVIPLPLPSLRLPPLLLPPALTRNSQRSEALPVICFSVKEFSGPPVCLPGCPLNLAVCIKESDRMNTKWIL